MSDVRKGQWTGWVTRDAFSRAFRAQFDDAAFDPHASSIDALEAIAWDAYRDSRKAPHTTKAGPEFADPTYDLDVEWLATRARLRAATKRWSDRGAPSRVLVVCASPRTDGTCPGEVSKTHRLVELARDELLAEDASLEIDLLDLSLLTSDPTRRIYPCKGCVSTAMPLCHWPCTCYPNHSLGQVNDWMAEIYERWTAAHGVLLVTPVHWLQAPSVLKLMIDRLVCADGGNDDPTTTHGKDPAKAKDIELAGWSYPKHLAGRAYAVVAHGDAAGVDTLRDSLCEWLDTLGLVSVGMAGRVGRYVGYYEPYATSHAALDRDAAFQEETRNAARALARGIAMLRHGELKSPDAALEDPRPK